MSDHHIRCVVDERDAVPVELAAGGVLFFNFGVAHCTKANATDRDRAGLALHFLRTDAIPPGATFGHPVPHLAGPEASGGAREYGARIAGTWDDEVARVLSSTA
jgi:hypothetical protein